MTLTLILRTEPVVDALEQARAERLAAEARHRQAVKDLEAAIERARQCRVIVQKAWEERNRAYERETAVKFPNVEAR